MSEKIYRVTRTDNPIADWDSYCEDEEQELERRICCDSCDEHIADSRCYFIDGYYYCDDCIMDVLNEYYKVETPYREDE